MGDMDHVYDYMLRFFLDLICYTLFTLEKFFVSYISIH